MTQGKHIECGCCEGIEILTPLPTANRPGLNALNYRVGTHATFLETMKARLSSRDYPALAGLTTRESNDFSIALLDAWATVADVLTFYQERIANEGYLRTATERRSILELSRLVGYKLRPGVASSVFLAYTLDEKYKDEVTIPKGARSQSIPGPGELPQSFETMEELKARAKWNNLKPRMTRPQTKESITAGRVISLKGIATKLVPNDPLLIDFSGDDQPGFFRVEKVEPDPAADRTLVTLQGGAQEQQVEVKQPISLIRDLTLRPSVQPRNSLRLQRDLGVLFSRRRTKQGTDQKSSITNGNGDHALVLRQALAAGEASHAALKAFSPALREKLPTAVENAQVTEPNPIRVYALRVKTSLFGHNHPGSPNYVKDQLGMIKIDTFTPPTLSGLRPSEIYEINRCLAKVALEPQGDQIKPDGWVVIERPPIDGSEGKVWKSSVHKVTEARQVTMSAWGVSSKVSLVTIDPPWLVDDQFKIGLTSESLVRYTTAYAQSEELELAEEPMGDSIGGEEQETIELDGLYEGLEAGRWVIVSGEREIEGTSGVKFSELAMLSVATQDVAPQDISPLAGDKTHTFIKLATKLNYCFKRETVTISGNVVKATHGETRKEVLGSGDGSAALQSFMLKQPPLTYVSASDPSGVDSTLKVTVNDILWHQTDSLAGLSPTDRNFITETDDEGKTKVIFGNGKEGARLPTGVENIKAEYRNGIGKGGNARAGQISLLTTRPLGVKAVINPLRASGGADKEGRDQARKNAPLAVKALDRLVSVQDYEDFARTYAGVGKAYAKELTDGRRQLVHVTIAGLDDIPIDENSDLFVNLQRALHDFGDPFQPIKLAVRELLLIVIRGRVSILPDYQWEPVVTDVRKALLDAFSFERRELGQDVLLGEVLSVMQSVQGAAYVDVDLLRGIPEKIPDTEERHLLTPDEIAAKVSGPLTDEDGKVLDQEEPLSRLVINLPERSKAGIIRPAQIAVLTPDVPATLILNPMT